MGGFLASRFCEVPDFSTELIAAVYGMEKMLYTISVGIDAVREGNRITYTKPGIL